MKDVLVNTITPGKYFTDKVFLDQKYILLSPETPISEEMLENLKKWHLHRVLTSGVEVDEIPGSLAGQSEQAPLVSLDMDMKEASEMEEARKIYGEILEFTEKTMSTFVSKGDLSLRNVTDQIKKSIDFVKSHKKYILRLGEMDSREKNYIVDHSTKTTVVSVAIGLSMKLPAHKLIELGTAALLHEIGMIRLPPQLYMSNKSLTPQEKKAMTAHTVLGFKILKQFSFPVSVCLAVLECRERLDGKGYPRGLTDDKISLYARIIAVSGSYAALVSERPFRQAYESHQVILELLKDRGKAYDENVLRALIANISIFPIGSFVLLNNGSRGMVVETNPENPRSPIVKVLASSSGERYSEPVAVRTDEPEYQIQRALTRDETLQLKNG
jgi:HD-GYP domain-containing protein (c-di-GMP phosphodiesterase class II)